MNLAFPDTNVLLYAFDSGHKRDISRRIMRAGGAISVQSLNEFTNVARRKLGFGWHDVRDAIEVLLTYYPHVVALNVVLQRDATRLAERYMLTIYDAQIIAAGLSAGCDIVYSEDMQNGLVVDGRLTIRNPFA